MKSIAVMTAFNEEKRISEVILGVRKYVDHIVVVDDGSSDNTAGVSRKAGASVISYPKNKGKGHAVIIGLRKAISMKPDSIIFLDADGQHDPKYIPAFLTALREAEYVYGKRNLSNYPIDRKIGNFGLTLLTSLLCPTGIKDTECGYRALTTGAARRMKLKGERYAVEMDFAYNVWKSKLKVGHVDIQVPVFHPKGAMRRGFSNMLFLLRRRFNLI